MGEESELVDRNGSFEHCQPLSESYGSPPLTPVQVVYTERFESKRDYDRSSINLIHCTRLDSRNTSQTSSDEQVPYIQSSTFQRNQEQNFEDMEKMWLSKNPSRDRELPFPAAAESQVRSRSVIPYSESSLPPITHTIILDFSMVHFVDSWASVILRQVSTEVALTKVMIPTYQHRPTLTELHQSLISYYMIPRPLETWILR